MYICISMYTFICVCVYVCMGTNQISGVYGLLQRSHLCDEYMHTYIHTYIHTYVYVYIYIYIGSVVFAIWFFGATHRSLLSLPFGSFVLL